MDKKPRKATGPQENPQKFLYLIIGILGVLLVVAIFLLTPGGGESVEIASVSPAGEVQQTTNFTFTFSREIVGDSLLNRQLDAAAIAFAPEVPGKFRWIGRNTLRFYPDVTLAPSTEYRIDVSPQLVSPGGYQLKGNRTFKVHTPRLRVNSAVVAFEFDPDLHDRTRLVSTIEFNYEVSPDAATDFVSLTSDGGTRIPFQLKTTSPNRILALEASEIERSDDAKKITLNIARGLKCVGGSLGLEQDFHKLADLPGQQDLKIVQVQPRKTSRKSNHIEIQFNLPVNAQTARSFITVEPELSFNLSTSHHYLRLTGDFQLGSTYQVTIRKGLHGVDGSPLDKDFLTAVTFRKEAIPPQLGFVGDGFYLPKNGNLNVGLSTINVQKVSLEVEKIYTNNLAYLLSSTDLTNPYSYYNLPALGRKVHESDVVIQNIENDEVVTTINVRDYLAGERRGIFKLTARMPDQRWRQSSQWVIATDLGMIAKKAGEDLWIWVNSLSDLTPVRDAQLTLLSQNNQKLLNATTNADGIAIFKNYTEFDDDLAPYLAVVEAGDDISFLELQRRQIPTSDFDVDGSTYLENGYEAFLYSERGVYRPGETVPIVTIVRGDHVSVPTPFPVTLRMSGPDEKILTEQRATLNKAGAAEFSVDVPDYAMTGRYTAALILGEKQELGRTLINIEEFVPDRMKVKLTSNRDAYSVTQPIELDVDAVTLFGPPASGRRVQAQIQIEAHAFTSPNWRTFNFSDDKKTFSSIRHDFAEQTLDEEGRYRYTYKVPANLEPPSALRGVASATVLEPGGRGVTAYKSVVIHPYEAYAGLRRRTDGYAEPGTDTPFEFIVVDPSGNSLAGRQVEISLYRVYWQSILKKVDSQRGYRYVSEKVEEPEHQFTMSSTDQVARFNVTPNDYGQYRLSIRDVESGASSSITFYASGWGYAPWAMDNPDRIELDLDKALYGAGDVATVQVRAPFPGKLLLTIEREKVFDYKVLDLPENTGAVEIPVKAEYKPNVYISAHLVRSTDSLERDMPARAFGVVPLKLNTDLERLAVELAAPAEIRPQSKLEVAVNVSGQQLGEPYVTIAAVDEGICQLTDFQTPDAHGYFFGKKRLSVESYDIYGVVLPELQSSLLSPAGDLVAGRKRMLTPVSVTRVKPVAFWSGLVKTDSQGRTRVSFDVPQFNGTLRVMAVAFSGDRFGKGEKKLFVREPVVITPTFPRFISSRDSLVIPVSVHNATGQAGQFNVELNAEGPVSIDGVSRQSLQLEKDQEGQVYFSIHSGEATGSVTFSVSASGNGERSQVSVDIPIRPPVPVITLFGYGSVEAGSTASFTFPDDWVPGTTDFSLTTSSLPAVRFAGSLQYLLHYPHGCIEQTTSRVFPLLYFDDIAKIAEPELFRANGADYFIEQGIAKLENLQLASGAFSYWPSGGYVNDWSSLYASHFLIEARKAGYTVSDRVYDKLLGAAQDISRSYRGDDRYSYQNAVYACYILALAGKPNKSSMLYMSNNALDKLGVDSQYQLAGAFALSGDLQTARTLLPKTVVPIDVNSKRESGHTFNSPIRTQAIMLDILATVDDRHPMVPALVANLTESASRTGRWYTTQENAYAFLALGKILNKQGSSQFEGQLNINGTAFAQFTEAEQAFSDTRWAGKTGKLSIQGQGTCYYTWRADGLPSRQSVDEFDHDLRVRRRFLDENGNRISFSQFRQGDLVIAEIAVTALTENLENVAIIDMLPAGLEIENPRLQSRQGISWIGNRDYHPTYMDIRDDRMILYGNFRHRQETKFYYGLRAVTRGEFVLPPVRAEAMYAPTKASVASSGKIVIREH